MKHIIKQQNKNPDFLFGTITVRTQWTTVGESLNKEDVTSRLKFFTDYKQPFYLLQ
jgi:hypothetical protein